jgi:hypothetical protein
MFNLFPSISAVATFFVIRLPLVKHYLDKWMCRPVLLPWPSRLPCLTHSDLSFMLLRSEHHLSVHDAKHDGVPEDTDYTHTAALVQDLSSSN